MNPMGGYLHPLYAQSFSEIGEPIFLPKSKGWLIKRHIPGTDYFDAMGPYPLFFCEDYESVLSDFENLKDQLVSISLVIGPFAKFSQQLYKVYFNIFYPYKDHYIFDTQQPLLESISKYSHRDARKALKKVSVAWEIAPNINLDEWVQLYDHLIERHNITGIRAFSRDCFSKQIRIPNTHFFKASHKGKVVAGDLFYIQGDVAYGHLLALSPKGYELGASHAIKWVAIQQLSKTVRWINFGGGTEKQSGLDSFKKGWSNTTGKSFFCGKILRHEIYQQLALNTDANGWFPVYRAGDF